MPVLVKSLADQVVHIQGQAYLKRPDGKLQLLKVGDVVRQGEMILTTQDGIVTLTDATRAAPVAQAAEPGDPCATAALGDELDAVIAGVSCGSPKFAPSAGVAGGGGGEGGDGGLASGLRIERITETSGNPGGLAGTSPLAASTPIAFGGGAPAPDSGPAGAGGGGTPGGGVGIGVDLDGDDSSGVSGTGRQTTFTEGEAPVAVADPDAVVTGSPGGAPITGATVTLVDPQPGDVLAVGGLPGGLSAVVDGTRVTIGGTASPDTYAQALQGITFANGTDDPGNANRQVAVTVTDGVQTSPMALLTVKVVPVNDAPLAGPDTVAVGYDSPQVAVDVLVNDRDPEGGTLRVTGATVDDPGRGTVQLLPDGTLGFTPAPGTSGPVVVRYQITDPDGGVGEGVLTVQVGPNLPPDGLPFAREVAEDGEYRFATNDFAFTDPDPGQTLAGIRIDSLPPSGVLALEGEPVVAGQFVPAAQLDRLVYTPPPDASGDLLGAFSFSVRDSAGDYAQQPDQVMITVAAQPDPAQVTPDSGSVVEDTQLVTGGTVGVTDPDPGEAVFQPQDGTAGAFGRFDLASDGRWTYTLDNASPAVQALGEGQTATETFTVRSADGSAGSVTVTIHGTNDGAVIDSSTANGPHAGSGSVTEDLVLSTGGTLTVEDADAGQAVFQPQPGTDGAHGRFTLEADGRWTYTLDNASPAVQALGEGQTATETFTVRSADGSAGSVTVTIHGTNDGAVIDSSTANGPHAGSGSVTEDLVLSTGGTLTVEDADAGQAVFQPQSGTAGAYGGFTLDAEGRWSYALDNTNPAVQALAEGQALTETFSVRSADGTESTVRVTINGTDDAAVISSATGTVTEDVATTAGGTLTIADADAGAGLAAFRPQAGTAGAYGRFTLDADGRWSYVLDNDSPVVQALGEGQTLTEDFAVQADDGTSSTVTLTIRGTNDAPVITSDGGGDAATLPGADGRSEVTTVTASDVDAGDTRSFAIVGGADADLFSIDAKTGALCFKSPPDFEAPADADRDNVYAVDVQVSDGRGGVDLQALQVAVTSGNAPPVAVADLVTLAEDTAASANVLANDRDPDAGSSLSVTQFSVAGLGSSFPAGSTVLLAGVGSFALAANGDASFTPARDYHGPVPPITYTVSDGELSSEATLELTVTPVDDKPVVIGLGGATLSEEGLAGANADSAGTPDTTDRACASGVVELAPGDAGGTPTFAFVAPGTALSSGGQAITWSGSGTGTLVGSAGERVVFTATIDEGGHYRLRLSGPLDHADAGSEDTLGFELTVCVTNGDGSTHTPLCVTVEDDSVRAAAPAESLTLGATVGATASGDLGFAIGADDAGASIVLGGRSVDADGFITAFHTGADGSTVTQALRYQGMRLHYEDSPSTGALYAVAEDGTVVFTVAPDAATGEYQATMLRALDPTLFTAGAYTVSTGDASAGYVLRDASGGLPVSLSGATRCASAAVNLGSSGIGVGNTWIDAGERLGLDFDTDMRQASFSTQGLGAKESLSWKAYGESGEVLATGTVRGDKDGAVSFSVGPGQLGDRCFERIEITGGNCSSFRVALDGATGESRLVQQSTLLQAVARDGDGDSSAPQVFALDFENPPGQTPHDGDVAHTRPGDFRDSRHTGFKDTARDDFKDTHRDDFKDTRRGDGQDTRHGGFKDSRHTGFKDTARDDFKDTHRDDFKDTRRGDGQDTRHGGFKDSGHTGFEDTGRGGGKRTRHGDFEDTGRHDARDTRRGDLADSRHGDFQDTVRCESRHSRPGDFGDTQPDSPAHTVLVGGADSHAAHGTAGTDVFRWQLADHEGHGRPGHDVVHDFDVAARSAGGDVLDLRELLVGEAAGPGGTAGNLGQYLHFDTTSVAGSTVIQVNSGGHAGSCGGEDRRITLDGVDLRASLGLGACASDDQIIQELLQRNKLDVGP